MRDPWWVDAECRDVDPTIFDRPTTNGRQRLPKDWARDALNICGRCPVREQCLDDAVRLVRDETTAWGVLHPYVVGGVTPDQLARLAHRHH